MRARLRRLSDNDANRDATSKQFVVPRSATTPAAPAFFPDVDVLVKKRLSCCACRAALAVSQSIAMSIPQNGILIRRIALEKEQYPPVTIGLRD